MVCPMGFATRCGVRRAPDVRAEQDARVGGYSCDLPSFSAGIAGVAGREA